MASMGYLYISGFIDENITITRTVRLIGSKLWWVQLPYKLANPGFIDGDIMLGFNGR